MINININKYLKIIFGMIIFLIICTTKVNASLLNVQSNKLTVTLGETFTVTISTSGSGRLNISADNATVSCASTFFTEGKVDDGASSITVTPKSVGTVKVYVVGELADSAGTDESVSKTISVTVKEKEENTTPPSSGGSSNDSGNSNNSSGTGTTKPNDNTNTTKPQTNNDTERETENNNQSQTTEREEEKKDSNNYLQSLVVSPSGLKPAFSKNQFEYKMKVGSDIKNLKVNAISESDRARIEVRDNTDLKIGENKVYIIVTAEDETKQVYTITVTKEEDREQLALNKLILRGFEFSPEFDPTVYEYEVTVGNEITEIPVEASSNTEDAIIEVIGNKDLPEGESVITIMVKLKGENGEEDEVVIYQITVKREQPQTMTELPIKYILAGGAAAVVIIIGIVVIIMKKRNQKSSKGFDYRDEIDEETKPGRGRGKH